MGTQSGPSVPNTEIESCGGVFSLLQNSSKISSTLHSRTILKHPSCFNTIGHDFCACSTFIQRSESFSASLDMRLTVLVLPA